MVRAHRYLLVSIISAQVILCTCHFSATDHTHGDVKHSTPSPAPPISDHRFFLHEIFTKYGHGGQMTFEGFEHLLESLGLGNIIITDHDVGAHRDNEFRNIHATHDHAKKDEHHDATTGKGVTDSHLSSQRSVSSQSPGGTSTTASSSTTHHRHFHNALPTSKKDEVDPSSQSHYTSDHDHVHEFPTTSHDNETLKNTGVPSENIYHYHLREVKIPELLVNISTLVDQHEELGERTPGFVIEQCLSPKEILDTFGINQTSSLNPVSFLHLCPAIIYELDQGHCMYRDHSHRKSKSITTIDQWVYSCAAIMIISLCGLLSVAVIPMMQNRFYHTFLQFLVGLAVGTLSGDGLLHLMPHAMLGGDALHDHKGLSSSADAEKRAVWHGLTALGGIFFFFVAERLLGAYSTRRKHKKDAKVKTSKGVSLSHLSELSHNGNVGEKLSQYRKRSYEFEMSEKEMIKMLSTDTFTSRKPSVESLSALDINFQGRPSFSITPNLSPHSPASDCSISVPEHHGHGHGHSHEVPESVSAVAWMVIMGDGLHNFCDGLAIGAAFASGIEGGISTTVAVFCHELPHELGDFAMLLKTGMKVKKALLYNGLSSVLCFIGMLIGVSLGNVHSATSWVFAATAGMFLYIALVDMLPELSTPSNDPDASSMYQLAVQVLGICCGVSIMFVIANYEQELQNIIS